MVEDPFLPGQKSPGVGESAVVEAVQKVAPGTSSSFSWPTGSKAVAQSTDGKFTFEPEKPDSSVVVTIYGEKGEGKTSIALGFPGTIDAVTLDRQTAPVWANMYKGDKRITVYNGVQFYVEDYASKERLPQAAATTFAYLGALLKHIEMKGDAKPDWVIIDGLEILVHIAEQVMRYDNNLGPTQGFANINLWKERRFHIRSIHNAALNAAKKGVIYTAYTDFSEEERRDGQVVKGKKAPKWTDVVLWETRCVIHAWSEKERTGTLRFWVEVDSNKVPNLLPTLQTGRKIDVTGNPQKIFAGG